MSQAKAKILKKSIKKVDGIFVEIKPTLDKLSKQEAVTSDELDKFQAACNPGRDYKRRRALQDKYGFLKPTSVREGLMAFGFECDDGWLPILEDLFEKIDKEVKKTGLKDFKVSQVKEKFGRLCVYTHGGTKEIRSLVESAERKASATCELCGRPGENRIGYKTTCKEHCERRNYA